jgi:hypothetical protein
MIVKKCSEELILTLSRNPASLNSCSKVCAPMMVPFAVWLWRLSLASFNDSFFLSESIGAATNFPSWLDIFCACKMLKCLGVECSPLRLTLQYLSQNGYG